MAKCQHPNLIVKIPEIHVVTSTPSRDPLTGKVTLVVDTQSSEPEQMGEIGLYCHECGLYEWYEDVGKSPQWVQDLYYADYT